MGHYNSFVVRIWSEEAEGTTRGHIQHVGTQEEMYFHSLDKMVSFMVSHLSPPDSSPVTAEKEAQLE
jgi:hypothetical protein